MNRQQFGGGGVIIRGINKHAVFPRLHIKITCSYQFVTNRTLLQAIMSEFSELKQKLYSESVVAKIWGVALSKLNDANPPTEMPEYSFFDDKGYIYRDMEYWTCGFFPGSKLHPLKLEHAAKWWAEPLKKEAPRTDTHDLGFIIAPVFIREHELTGSKEALEILVAAANALASRFDETIGCIRSWDTAVNKRYNYSDTEKDFLVIIDNMCNLDLLYYVAQKTGDLRLSSIATRHAETTLKHHFRDDWSCYHVLNYNKKNGEVIAKFTNQGFADESAWSRGQAWAIMGYADVYAFTKQRKFLDAAISLADYFLGQLPQDGVPAWDFKAPDKEVRDVSAGMIASLGMLSIFESTKDQKFLELALRLTDNCVRFAYNEESKLHEGGKVSLGKFDAILHASTINNNPVAPKQIANHGLVYADYYFLTIGNRLLDLGVFK